MTTQAFRIIEIEDFLIFQVANITIPVLFGIVKIELINQSYISMN